MSGILVTMWRHFSYHLVCRPRLWLTFEGQEQKFAVCLRSNFYFNFGHFLGLFNPVFYFHFKNIIFFLKSNQNLRFYNVFSLVLFSLQKNSFFMRKWLPKCEGIVRRIPMSSDIVSHNVSGILLTLWLTLWEDCESIVSGDEYP